MKRIFSCGILLSLLLFVAAAAGAQTTSFVYQGKLTDGAVAANGTYQFQFKLYDAEAGGSQIGLTLVDVTATVTNGVFAVPLNFGGGAFNAAEFRFLEIAVRPGGSGQPYATLAPRQQLTSTPYAIRALNAQLADTAVESGNAANLGNVPAAQYVVTSDPRMTDERGPLAGSPNYIQNGTSQQANASFNVAGEGKAFKLTSVLVNATSEYQQGGARVLQFNGLKSGFVGLFTGVNSTGADNMFAGYEAGRDNTTGSYNAFFGSQSGRGNTTGLNNSFFGAYAGVVNTTGGNNAFFGANAGLVNGSGATNSFFGSNAGISNTSGSNNSLFGNLAGSSLTIAGNNAMFGARAGENTTTGGNAFFGTFAGQKNNAGSANVFVGMNAGKENLSGANNVYLGFGAGGNNQNGSNNIAVGAGAGVGAGVSNSIALGANVLAAQSNTLVVGGVTQGIFNLDAQYNGNVLASGTGTFLNGVGGSKVSAGQGGLTVAGAATFNGEVTLTGAFNGTTVAASGNGLFQGSLRADNLGTKQLWNGGSTPVCAVSVQGYLYLANCSSSARYKDEIETYRGGLDVLKKLRPVTFRWKSGGRRDVGFVAEEVGDAEPLLNNYDEKGAIEGVKYAQVTTVLVNAAKEQQSEIENLAARVKKQEAEIAALKALVCARNAAADVCRAPEE